MAATPAIGDRACETASSSAFSSSWPAMFTRRRISVPGIRTGSLTVETRHLEGAGGRVEMNIFVGRRLPKWVNRYRNALSVPCPLSPIATRQRILRFGSFMPIALNVTGLVASGAAQREGVERGQLTVRPHHIVIGDLDRGDAAAL